MRKAEFARNSALFSDVPQLAFSYAYLHHLFKAGEMLGPLLASMHNLNFITGLVKDIRQSILDDSMAQFKADFLAQYRY